MWAVQGTNIILCLRLGFKIMVVDFFYEVCVDKYTVRQLFRESWVVYDPL